MILLKQYEDWYNLNGDRWQDTRYIFVQENVLPMHPTSITTWLNRFSKQHPELPHLNPHTFRHTQASLLYFAGIDSVTISKRLGHAQVSTTQNFYAHIIQEADEIAAEYVTNKIFQKKSKAVDHFNIFICHQEKTKVPKH